MTEIADMKKRLFISIHYMEIGGAETSLIGLLQAMDYSRYDVDLFVYSHQGELMHFIPPEVNLLPEIAGYSHIEKPLMVNIVSGYWRIAFGKIKAKIKHKRYKNNHTSDKEDYSYQQYMATSLIDYLPSLYNYGEYDLAISFMHPHNYVLNKVKAKKKICWIHTDYSVVHVNVDMELPVWSAYENVISISDDVTRSFLSVFPTLKDKIVLMENILSPEFVRNRAEELDVQPVFEACGFRGIRLLSVGRFSYAKNYDSIPDICRCIEGIDNTIDYRWFIIGYGQEEQLIRTKIAEAGMEDRIVILGKRSNPYPYIKACDIYVQPSRYEGKSVTVREAQILCKPVVVTNYPTAPSQIVDGEEGVIVPLDNQSCAEGIVNFINDTSKQKEIIAYLQTHDYGNEKEVEKIYHMMSD